MSKRPDLLSQEEFTKISLMARSKDQELRELARMLIEPIWEKTQWKVTDKEYDLAQELEYLFYVEQFNRNYNESKLEICRIS